MPISRVNFQNVAIPPATDSGGGGGGNAGAWTTLTSSDLETNAQSYQTFTLSASSEAGFDNRISIANNAVGVFNSFPQDDVGVLYFDTGFSVDNIGDDNANNAVFQIMWEPYGMDPSSTYRTNKGYPLGVCLFSSLTPPPFTTGSQKGGFYGNGILHTLSGGFLRSNYALSRRMRDHTTAGLVGPNYLYTANTSFKALVHTVTVAQGANASNTKALCVTQGDFMAYYNDESNDLDRVIESIGQQQDNSNGFSTSNSDTIILGVMFNLYIDTTNGGVNPSPTLTWDFNLKWRKLNTEA